MFNCALNPLGFAAILALLVSGRALLRDRRTLAVAIACLLPIAIIFGIIPASLLVRIPFIANIHHTDNTFSCGLLVLATILAGPGLVALLHRVGEKTWWVRAGGVLILAGLAAWVWWRHAGSATG